ncbi:MAG TPA: hypothetical protein VN878_09040 [Usitatibacter sp.]|nr:hypothetical protein [Usitatibacter sp.]
MGDTLLIVVVFGGMTIAIWLSYKFFMRGSTNKEKVASMLPKGFKPDWAFRCGDTYVGFESASDRLALVDWPHAKVVSPREIISIEKLDDSVWGLKHRWIVVTLDDPKIPRYRVWFRFRKGLRDEWYSKLLALQNASRAAH